MGGPYGPIHGLGHRHAYLAAAVVMGSICLVSTITMFYLAGTHNDLKQRGRYLVFWNGLSATGIVAVYLMLNAYVGDFPCFILLWTSYLCIVPWLLTYLARGFRLVYIYNQQVDFGNRILQRSNLESHTNTSQQNLTASDPTEGALNTPNTNRGASAVNMDTGSNTVFGSSTTVPNSSNPDLNGAVTLPPSTTSRRAPERTHSLTRRGQENEHEHEHEHEQQQGAPTRSNGSRPLSSLASNIPSSSNATSFPSQPPPPTRSGSRLFVPESYQLNAVTSPSPNTLFPEIRGVVFEDSPHSPISNRGDPELQLMTFGAPEEDSHWNRYLPFNQVTDGRLTFFLMVIMAPVTALCLGMQFVKPSPVQIAPINYLCGDGPVFFPVYAFMLGFLTIGCPMLSWKLWWIKDGYGIRNELLINMIIGLPGFILYFISPLKMKKLDAGHWNHTNWLTITIFCTHFNSVVLPLLRFFRRQTPQSMLDGKSKPMTSIFKWDSNKSVPGTPNPDADSDTASFGFHSRSTSQTLPSSIGSMDMDGISMEPPSHCHPSVTSQGISIIPDVSIGTTTMARSRSRSRSVSKPPRYRGMKGFWAKYGTDSEGKMIPLSQMDPQAFEYALHDQEMLAELVKFSITVFSAENTKFLQEYDGLKKQVQEYYRLVGAQTQRKHSRSGTVSSDNAIGEASGSGSQPSTTSHRKVPSILESVASSLRKLSMHGSSDGCHSRCGSQSGNMIDFPSANGAPIATTRSYHVMTHPSPTPRSHKISHKHSGSLWRISLMSSTRNSANSGSTDSNSSSNSDTITNTNSSTTPTNPPVPKNDLVQDVTVIPHFHHLHHSIGPSPLSPRSTTERRVLQRSTTERAYHSDRTFSALENHLSDPTDQDSRESSVNSWYGQGTSGSALSYHDVTPSETSSFYNGSEDLYYYPHSKYCVQDTDSSAHYNIGDESVVRVQISSPLGQDTSEVETNNWPDCPGAPTRMTSMSVPRMNSLSSFGSVNGSGDNSLQIAAGSTSASQVGRGISSSYPSMHATQMRSQSPLHSPSSSVSATFTPRLPSQPSLTAHAMKPLALVVDKCTSPRSVLTAEEHLQTQGTTSISPLSCQEISQQISPIRQQQPQVSYFLSLDQQQQNNMLRLRPSYQSSQNMLISALMLDRKTAVPDALLPAYWEIASTFIMPNSVLELNLNETQVEDIRALFVTHDCFLEMYEPVVRTVQELVYANVWPRFVQTLQKHPRGLPKKMGRTWMAFFYRNAPGGGEQDVEEDGEESVATGSVEESERKAVGSSRFSLAGIQARWRQYWRRTSQSRDGGERHAQSGTEMTRGDHGENMASGGGDDDDEKDTDGLRQFGVMQELDLSALQHIIVSGNLPR
ncbi:hypothetical protein MVEG_01850 [Podila verticillata NRRL 6337]|nr:hypothetical protein MVEG_01850 [Podila verticillata NRRL 6337]